MPRKILIAALLAAAAPVAHAQPSFNALIDDVEPRLIAWRRHLHQNPELTSRMLGALERAAGPGKVREIPPILSSEDFGAYSTAAPSFFWFLNAPLQADRAGAPNHSPLFMIGEQYMKTGVAAFVHVSLEYMRAKAGK